MTIIPEDGTGVPLANSYITVDFADGYHSLRGNPAWAAVDASQKPAKLVQATDYLEATYRAYAPALSLLQGLQWPSWGSLAVPAPVEAATALLALYALSGPLQSPATRGIKSTVKKLEGVGDLETVYDAASDDPYPYITALLSSVASKRGSGGLIVGRLIV